MKYFSINLYRKMLNCAMAEGMDRDDFAQKTIATGVWNQDVSGASKFDIR